MMKNNYIDNTKELATLEHEQILDENNELEESTETDSLAEIYNMIKNEMEDIGYFLLFNNRFIHGSKPFYRQHRNCQKRNQS